MEFNICACRRRATSAASDAGAPKRTAESNQLSLCEESFPASLQQYYGRSVPARFLANQQARPRCHWVRSDSRMVLNSSVVVRREKRPKAAKETQNHSEKASTRFNRNREVV